MNDITLQTLRDWDACSEGYDKIAKHVGENEVIDLDLALRVLAVEDVVWGLSHDPDRHRWLSFLADMIDLPGYEATTQTIRDYRDGRLAFEDLRKIASDTDVYTAARSAMYSVVHHTTVRGAIHASNAASRAAEETRNSRSFH